MISELQNISSSLCFIPWRNSGSKKGAMDDKSVQCGMIFPRNLMQVCAHKWASNLAPYIDSQIRQLRKQRLRGEAWVTCEVTYNRVKQKKTKRMMDEEGMIFSSVCPRRSDYFSFLDKLREVEVWSDTSHYSFVRNITGCSNDMNITRHENDMNSYCAFQRMAQLFRIEEKVSKYVLHKGN